MYVAQTGLRTLKIISFTIFNISEVIFSKLLMILSIKRFLQHSFLHLISDHWCEIAPLHNTCICLTEKTWKRINHEHWDLKDLSLEGYYRVVKSSWLLVKFTTYLVSIGKLLCLAFLCGWCFSNKISLAGHLL